MSRSKMVGVVRKDFSVKTLDGVTIAIRSVRLEGAGVQPKVPMILMHGTRIPGISEFDLPVPNGSLAEDLARKGHVCYIPVARGFGNFDSPPAMAHPPTQVK